MAKISVPLPDDLHEALRERAAADRRSLVQELIVLLHQALSFKMTPIGYQGAAQHTYTPACDGFHEAGPCP